MIEGPLLEAKMAPFLDSYRAREISDYELTAIFILTSLSLRYPGSWLGAKCPSHNIEHNLTMKFPDLNLEPNIRRRLEEVENLGELFSNFALKSTPKTVNRALLQWSNGSYPLELMFRIPTPSEVLSQQKMGRRCLTVLTDSPKTTQFILGERDYLSFTMHDLIHADHFYFHPHSYQGQLGFYGLLDYGIKEAHFDLFLKNKNFKDEFEYLISDMNAYAIHLLKCLKAAILHYYSEGDFYEWIYKLNPEKEVTNALVELNTHSYYPLKQDEILLKWLEKWRQI